MNVVWKLIYKHLKLLCSKFVGYVVISALTIVFRLLLLAQKSFKIYYPSYCPGALSFYLYVFSCTLLLFCPFPPKVYSLLLVLPIPCILFNLHRSIVALQYHVRFLLYGKVNQSCKAKVKVTQSCPTLCDPVDCPLNSLGQNTGGKGKPFPSPGDLPNPGIKPRSPALQADSLPVEPQGKPKNTGVGSLSLLQRIFLSQKSNWGLLHCRWILYQVSYQGSTSVIHKHAPTLFLGFFPI